MDPLVLAANSILLQYFHFMAYGVDGFALAAESLVGKYAGSGQGDDLRKVIRKVFVWGLAGGLLFALAYLVAGQALLSLMTNQPAVIETAQPYVNWMAFISLAGAVAFMYDGVYVGLTATRTMRNTMILAVLFIFLPAYYLTQSAWGNHGLWFAFSLFMLARGVFLGLMLPKNLPAGAHPITGIS
jgi:MATE family multidrug resistance protein